MAEGGVLLEVHEELIATDWIKPCQLRPWRRAERYKTHDSGGCEIGGNLAPKRRWFKALAT